MMKRILFAFFVLSMALSATAQRVYINPGHGTKPNVASAEPDINWELNGGIVLPTNAELWETFKPYYNTFYADDAEAKCPRGDQPIDKVSTFATAKMQKIMTDAASEYKWLGDYILSVASSQGVALPTDMANANEGAWRWAVHAFFNAAAGQYGAAGTDFTTAGKPEAWGPAYQAAHGGSTELPSSVTWVLNGGHVYPSNDWLWEDFRKTFNSVSATKFNSRPTTYEEFYSVWRTSETNCYMLTLVDGYTSDSYTRYHWLGHYLWAKAETASQNNMSSGNEWWGKLLWAFLNCTACEYTANDINISVDFSVAGQPKSWRKGAIEYNSAQDFYNEIFLPTTITTDYYTIPIPEKAGAIFQGWYDNPLGLEDPKTVLPEGYDGTVYAIWEGQVPCIVAYDLNCKYKPGAMAFDFSFYANTQPAFGKLIFYTKNGQTTKEIELSNLHQGKNTVSIQAASLRELGLELGKDIYWEVHLEASPSTLFAEIFRSQPFNTAYATIDNSPESDFFGSIWVANQKTHGYNNTTDGEIWRLVPEQGYARDAEKGATKGHRPHRPGNTNPNTENEKGFEVIFRPTVAPDGNVYLTDNGSYYGGVFVMDPHDKTITNFFEGCKYANGEWKMGDQIVGSGSTGAHIYWTENEAKLYLMHNYHADKGSRGSTKGFFVYDLKGNNLSPQRTELINADVTDYAIVGTSRGAWVCQLRYEGQNSSSHPSLTFYPSDNTKPATIFSDKGLIPGSFGSAIAVSKDEKLLAMVGGTGNIMLFDIAWSNDNTTPTLTKKGNYPVVADDPNTDGNYEPTITTLNFDYAGNLVATLGDTYNDARDKHKVVIFTLPKETNHINVPARFSQRVPGLVEDEQCKSEAAANTTYETVQLCRKLQSGMYNTICLPFGITSLTDTPLEGASVLAFESSTVDTKGGEPVLKLNFQEVQQMQAGVPYLIKPLKDIKDPMLFSNVETGNSVEAQAVTKGGITFHGVMNPTELRDQNMLMLVANNRLATSTGGTMLGNRGYFVIGNPQNMPKRAEIAIVKGASSSDNNIHVDDYQPTVTKVLENGVIFIIRDGVKYNLMGARIK